jgi:hypothetical protein
MLLESLIQNIALPQNNLHKIEIEYQKAGWGKRDAVFKVLAKTQIFIEIEDNLNNLLHPQCIFYITKFDQSLVNQYYSYINIFGNQLTYNNISITFENNL